MVFQKPNPFPMSIYDNIAYGPRTHGIKSRAKLDDIVERSLRDAAIWDEVKDRLKKSALGLSGGQQQRLCIARALAVEPEVLLMDEPTSALDPISTAKIEELAMELKTRYTIVIVTHNMQQAVRISDNTAFFLLGELIEYGVPERPELVEVGVGQLVLHEHRADHAGNTDEHQKADREPHRTQQFEHVGVEAARRRLGGHRSHFRKKGGCRMACPLF